KYLDSRTETELILEWNKVNNSDNYSYRLIYNIMNITINGSDFENDTVTRNISSLSPGTKYTFTLYTVFEEVESSGFYFSSVTSKYRFLIVYLGYYDTVCEV
uniref:Fibronectin type-III domain-containing protein n=1 Tax=Astyanax mexicanus TaxID=7994 RepID=A0A8B9REH6_ASTMX